MRYLKAGHGKDLLEKVDAAFAVVAGIQIQDANRKTC